jgi:hypothetical protein
MAAGALAVKDANNATQSLSVTQDPTNSNAYVGSSSVTDPSTGLKASVQVLHQADNQQPGASAAGILTGGVAQVLNVAGNLDRQRETGTDGVPSQGIATGAAQFAMGFKTSSSGAISIGTQTVTPAAMSGVIGGVPWSIQAGSTLLIDTGTNQEAVTVISLPSATTFQALFAKSHTNPVIRGFVYNQERDAAGEADGATGIGTAVAAEYEFNGGGPGGGNFDRARSVQAKARTTATISSGGTQGSTSLVVASAGTLKAGMQITLLKAATFPAAGSFEVVYIDPSYVEGGTTVPLTSAIVLSVPYDTIAYDSFSANGPGLNGFNATGIGIEEEALWDPVSGLFYIERAATADACAPQNVVLESPGLWNGASMDRARAALNAIGAESTRGGGISNTYNVTAATAIKAAPGRLMRVSVVTAGSTVGTANDCASTGAAAAANQIATIPNAVGVIYLDWPCATGIVLVPGTGQVLAVNFD